MSNKPFQIAISGRSGCGNTTVSRKVAEALDLQWINYTFRSIAEEMGMPFEEFCQLAEQDDKWDIKVDETQVELARKADSVLGSRLAIWMVKEADLKVFLTASEEVRAYRIRQREGGDTDGLLEATRERDARDHKRYLRIYDIDNEDFAFADLVINTERLDADQVSAIIIEAAKAVRYHL